MRCFANVQRRVALLGLGLLAISCDSGPMDRADDLRAAEAPPPPNSSCDEQLAAAVAAGGLPVVGLVADGVAQLVPTAVSCEDLLQIPGNNPVSHGQAICSWKVAYVSGMDPESLEFVVWEGPGGESLCGCRCPSCDTLDISPTEYDAVGSGTALDPYELSTYQQLVHLGASPAGWDDHFVQCEDIELASHYAGGGTEFQLGNSGTHFTGSYDGNEHSIADFRLSGFVNAAGAGLFGYATGAVVNDLTLENVLIELDDDPLEVNAGIGAMVGTGQGVELLDVAVASGTVAGQANVGGLAGLLQGSTVENSTSDVSVVGRLSTGGLVGRVRSTTLAHVSAWGNVAAPTISAPGPISSSIGGLFGGAADGSSVSQCEAHGTVAPVQLEVFTVGGLGGHLDESTLSGCYADGAVTAASSVGGLLGGVSGSSVEWSYATGNVTADGFINGLGTAGGFVGRLDAAGGATFHVANCYASGNVDAVSEAGGFGVTGQMPGWPDEDLVIENCYASGDVYTAPQQWPNQGGSATFLYVYPGIPPVVQTSFGYGYAQSTFGPPATFHFASFPADSSNFYNEDQPTFINPFALGPQPASAAAGHFQAPNAPPMSLGWPAGWDFAGALPTIPGAGE